MVQYISRKGYAGYLSGYKMATSWQLNYDCEVKIIIMSTYNIIHKK
jgi:hypothetical protein